MTGPAGPIVVLRVAGEIDMLTLPIVEGGLVAATDRHPADLVIDLAAVVFCCGRGIALLARAAVAAQSCGIGYALSGLSPHLDRVATLLWPEPRVVQYPSAAAALTAIRIDHTTRTG